VRRVTNSTALLDVYAEENAAAPIRALAYALAQTPRDLSGDWQRNLERTGIEYSVIDAAAARLVPPFVTAIPVAEVWVTTKKGHEELSDGAQAKPVTKGANLVFLQTEGDTPRVPRERTKELWFVNRFQLYTDLRREPVTAGNGLTIVAGRSSEFE
jgi:hypothetical protein